MKKYGVLVALLAMALITSALWAAGPRAGVRGQRVDRPGAGQGQRATFDELDKNGDGVITRDEFGPKILELFDKLDADKDGKVTQEEVKQYADAHQQGRDPDKLFTRLDKNADGTLVKEEMPSKMQARFTNMDANTDGKVTKEEFAAAIAKIKDQVGHGPFFQKFDANNDGTVTKEEVNTKTDEAFKKLDKDNDGKISKDEMKEGAGTERLRPTATGAKRT